MAWHYFLRKVYNFLNLSKNGKAVKVHEEEVPQIIVAIASPTGLEVNKTIAIVETPIMLNATQMPVLRNNKSTEIKNTQRNISIIIIKASQQLMKNTYKKN